MFLVDERPGEVVIVENGRNSRLLPGVRVLA